MIIMTWFISLLIGTIIGLIALPIFRNRERDSYEFLVSIFGAFVGSFIFNFFGFASITDFHPWSALAAIVGAIAVLAAYYWWDNSYIKAKLDLYITDPLLTIMSRQKIHRPIPRYHVLIVPAIIVIPFLDVFFTQGRIADISLMGRPPFGAIERYSTEEGRLDYLVYRPNSAQRNAALPLLMMLHGCSQDPFMLEAATGMRELADTHNFMLVYPQQSASASPHRCWNWYDDANQSRESGEAAVLAGIVRHVTENYAVDESRIYVAGINSGGAMAGILASCFPDVFAAAAIHSGMGYQSATTMFQALFAPFAGSQTAPHRAGVAAYNCSGNQNQMIPVLVLQGMADNVVSPLNASNTIEAFAQMNDFEDDGQDNDSIQASGSMQSLDGAGGYSYTIEDYVSNEQLLLRVYRINGLDYRWSGGRGIMSDPKAPDASEIFWGFLSSYRLNSP